MRCQTMSILSCVLLSSTHVYAVPAAVAAAAVTTNDLVPEGVPATATATEAVSAALHTDTRNLNPDNILRSGGYAQTCSGSYIQGSAATGGIYLYTICGNGGGQQRANIKLGSCITNFFGGLAYAVNGNFGVTCSNPALDGSVLSANCADGRGGNPRSSIDLNTVIGNIGGNLVC